MKNENQTIESIPVQEIIKRIISVTSPNKIIFFGSYAYGTPRLDSDIDIIVVTSVRGSKIDEYRKIRKSLKGLGYPFDIIVLSMEEFDFYSKSWKNSVIAEATQKGKLLYEKNQ